MQAQVAGELGVERGHENGPLPAEHRMTVHRRQDLDAVVAAMGIPYSQGQTKGRINELRLGKRSMYGRGRYDLLKQRMLYVAAS